MKRIYKIVAMIVTVFALVGCDWVIQNENNPTYVNYWVSYENKTQRHIDLTIVYASNPISVPSDAYTYDNYVLEAGGHCQAGLGTVRNESGETLTEKLHHLIIPESVCIVYDNKYSVTFERNTENDNLCKLEDYQMLNIHECATACHYDFTEADYEYAKTYGVEVDIEITE